MSEAYADVVSCVALLSVTSSFLRQVRHDVVHFIYMHCLLALDRHDDVPCTDGGDRTEGGREAQLGSNGWVIISRAVQNVPDYGHHRKVGLPQDVG